MSVRRSAGDAPVVPARSSSDAGFGSTRDPGFGSITGWKAQCVFAASRCCSIFVRARAPSRGSGAPIFTHSSSAAIWSSASLPSGGIFRWSLSYLIAWMMSDFDGSPATRAGPVSPPFSTPAFVSSSRLPFSSVSAAWQS